MTNLDSRLKSRDITLPTKVRLVKAMVFPVVMYGCESWTEESGCRKIDAFELWCWIRLLRVPWTARRSNQSILKEISPRCSLEELMLKLKLQYFGHFMRRIDSLEETLMLGGIGGRRRRGRQRMRWLDGITIPMGSLWWTWRSGMLQFMGSQRIRHDWVTELNWTEVAQIVKNLPATWETWVDPWVGKIPWRRAWQPTPVFLFGESRGHGELQSVGSQRVRHSWSTKHSTAPVLRYWPRCCKKWRGMLSEFQKTFVKARPG